MRYSNAPRCPLAQRPSEPGRRDWNFRRAGTASRARSRRRTARSRRRRRRRSPLRCAGRGRRMTSTASKRPSSPASLRVRENSPMPHSPEGAAAPSFHTKLPPHSHLVPPGFPAARSPKPGNPKAPLRLPGGRGRLRSAPGPGRRDREHREGLAAAERGDGPCSGAHQSCGVLKRDAVGWKCCATSATQLLCICAGAAAGGRCAGGRCVAWGPPARCATQLSSRHKLSEGFGGHTLWVLKNLSHVMNRNPGRRWRALDQAGSVAGGLLRDRCVQGIGWTRSLLHATWRRKSALGHELPQRTSRHITLRRLGHRRAAHARDAGPALRSVHSLAFTAFVVSGRAGEQRTSVQAAAAKGGAGDCWGVCGAAREQCTVARSLADTSGSNRGSNAATSGGGGC